MTVPVAIFTADHRHDVLRVMLYFYLKYWDWPAIVFGFKPPAFPLDKKIQFISLGDMADYPANKWSNGVLKALDFIEGDRFVMLLEDYWLTRYVDTEAIDWLADYMSTHPDIARADLTSDRLYSSNLREIGAKVRLDLIENDPPADYHFSTQAGIWDKELLRGYLLPDETPWRSELEGTNRMKEAFFAGEPARVIGTRQFPVRYLIAVQAGRITLDGGYQKPAPVMSKIDQEIAKELLHQHIGNVDFAFAGLAK